MNNFNANITVDAVLMQQEQESEAKTFKTAFDVKNYLQVRLNDYEKTKTLTIRLLPFSKDEPSPFKKVYFHNIKVGNTWKRIPCQIKNELGEHKCPFCETAQQALELERSSVSEVEKKKYKEVRNSFWVKEFWIVRCIERGHEEDGVKFWLFSNSKKGDGSYDKIMNIFKTRYERAKAQGKINNIFDLNDGKDLEITLTKDTNNKTVVNITDADEKSPLSENYDLANSWINDEKKWYNVYTIKPYDYMSIIVNGGTPFYDKESHKYINKDDMNKEIENDIEKNLYHEKVDLSVPPTQEKNNMENIFVNSSDYLNSNDDDDEDDGLPF